MRGRALELRGQRFGKLVAIAEAGRDRFGKIQWECRCDCGGRVVTASSALSLGRTKSCGCTPGGRAGRPRVSHQLSKTPEYRVWVYLRERCLNPKCPYFKDYGARGITVHPSWLGEDGFANFIRDVGRRPAAGLSLDRINNDGNYEPGNCRWTDHATQARNRRDNRMFTINGETLCLKDWAVRYGVPYPTAGSRVRKGWPIERALSKERLPSWR